MGQRGNASRAGRYSLSAPGGGEGQGEVGVFSMASTCARHCSAAGDTPDHSAVHGAGEWGQALRMQRADHRPSGEAGPERLQGAARWPGARPAGSQRRRGGPAWATMSRLVPLCATLCRSFCATLCHFVPAYAGICRFEVFPCKTEALQGETGLRAGRRFRKSGPASAAGRGRDNPAGSDVNAGPKAPPSAEASPCRTPARRPGT